MVRGGDGKWRSMANERLYESKMLLGALYRSELAAGLVRLGYGIEKTHADGRFEIAGVSREVVEAFSTRRAEIEAAVAERGGGETADNQRLAQRAALMTPAGRSGRVGGGRPRRSGSMPGGSRRRQCRTKPAGTCPRRQSGTPAPSSARVRAGETAACPPGRWARPTLAVEAVDWAVAHLSEREAVFARTDLLAAALAHDPGAVRIGDVEHEVAGRETAGTLHAARLPGADGLLTTDRAVADERETIALVRTGERRGAVDKALRGRPLTAGQKEAVKLILSSGDRTVGVQSYAGSGKTTMLRRARALMEKKATRSGVSRPRPRPCAPSKARPASAARPCSASSPATPASPKGA